MKKITFIGAGSMAEAIISGLVAQQVVDPKNINVTNKSNEARLASLNEKYGVTGTRNIQEAMKEADVVLLAVKPKDMLATMQSIQPYITTEMMLVSVAAGVHTASLEGIAAKEVAVIRAMPNTSATVGQSATAISTNAYTSAEQRQTAITLFETIGSVVVVEEEQLDAVTGLSGSGPAYLYYLVEAMEKSAQDLGLDADTAKQLIIQTMLGAAQMLKHSTKSPATLRKEVTSPGGTTEAGLKVLQNYEVDQAFIACIEEATAQSKRMGKQISDKLAQYAVPR
ncbi:pyrroline-5-carboxylate reductase [Peribacillus asahii]|uniref:Pyrroline-5-carboxylate reductase n=1 Tax=Peribacillus asahii TaxID=228899 RepID=A0A3T0KUY4_9BACI|nr:pyrroline-5-carboxylate reductase [Peribacillus asahii]AZV44227.1 pyrroline-5-carboxylate reductase [Peribacillus asahii]USK83939.1 pyrroline-5-carboxylate reductase [Peribacillus asahii]